MERIMSESMPCNTTRVGEVPTTLTNSTNLNRIGLTANDPLLYIVTVLMFYAISMTVLLVKYVRREKEEAEFSSYYYEYVSRDKFHTAQYQNAQQIKRAMKAISDRKRQKSKTEANELDCVDTDKLLLDESCPQHHEQA